MGYNARTAQYVPVYQLDTDNATVAVFDEKSNKNTENSLFGCVTKVISFHTAYVADHIRYVMQHSPERFNRLLNDGKIIEYLDDIENRAFEAVENQVDKWIESDKEYQLAKLNGDIIKQAGLENNLVAMAKEIIYPAIIYV
jgi:hypothetical protein